MPAAWFEAGTEYDALRAAARAIGVGIGGSGAGGCADSLEDCG
jgi:hypothetical protein